jgi:hypothetical protein
MPKSRRGQTRQQRTLLAQIGYRLFPERYSYHFGFWILDFGFFGLSGLANPDIPLIL